MIIFAKTRYHYDSYSDFWELVKLSGFDTCFVDEIDIASENTYITTPINGEFRPHIKYHRDELKKTWNAKIVWWNLERPTSITNFEIGDVIGYINESWVSDKYYASLNPNFKFVALGSHSSLRLHKENIEKIYDYTHMSYVSFRRDHIYGGLNVRGLKVGNNSWGEERDIVLRSSKLLLNIHQDEFQITEPLRYAVCAAYSLPIISETNINPFPLISGVDLIESNYHNIANKVLSSYNSDLTAIGNNLYNKLCVENTFRDCVEKGLGLK